MSGTVAVLGHLPMEWDSVERLAWKFGWALKHAGTLGELAGFGERNVVAVLFEPKDLDPHLRIAVQRVRQAAPDALPIICRRFSETNHEPAETADAYHILHYPFALNEIRQLAQWIGWKFIQRRRFLRQLDVARITPEELRDRLNAGEDLFIVDLRSPLAESPNLIPGARSISPEDLATRSQEIPRDRDIILFCG